MSASVPMREYVVDSSVAFKWFAARGEDSVSEAWELLERHARGEIRLIAPPIMPYEVLNGLRYAGVKPQDLKSAAEGLAEADIPLIGADKTMLVEATRIATEDDLTVYDASFVALAKLRDCELVTADGKAFGSIDECRVRIL